MHRYNIFFLIWPHYIHLGQICNYFEECMDAIIRLIHFISLIKIGGKKQFDVKKNFEGEVCRILNVLPSAKRTICVTFLVATLITWVHWQYSPHWSMLVLLQTTFWLSTVSGLTYKKSSKNAIIRTKKRICSF